MRAQKIAVAIMLSAYTIGVVFNPTISMVGKAPLLIVGVFVMAGVIARLGARGWLAVGAVGVALSGLLCLADRLYRDGRV